MDEIEKLDASTVSARAAAIAAALGGDITDLTTHSAMIGFPDGLYEGLRVLIRFRTYGMAVGKAKAQAVLPAINGFPSADVGSEVGFDSNLPLAKLAPRLMARLMGPDTLAEARSRKAQRESDAQAKAELMARVGTLTDAFPDLRARVSGDTAAFNIVVSNGAGYRHLEFNLTVGSDDVQITHGRATMKDLIAILEQLTSVSA